MENGASQVLRLEVLVVAVVIPFLGRMWHFTAQHLNHTCFIFLLLCDLYVFRLSLHHLKKLVPSVVLECVLCAAGGLCINVLIG